LTFLYYELNSFAMADLTQIADQITQTLIRDRHALTRELRAIRKEKSKQHVNGSIIKKRILNLQKKTEQSLARKAKRQDLVPAKIHFDRNLPITAKKEDIIQAVQQHRVVIISGETGSGKTTQIPKFCLEAGRGLDGMIGCTQPRRIAAITVARRIADELSQPLGQAVGYKIRFDDRTDENALIKLMTDGILLAETQKDRFLNSYDTLIVDEAHERSLNIDFTLGLLRRLIQKRDDLKLIITSATIDTQKFSQAFGNAPVIEVSGRMYPVETRYVPFINKDDDRQSI
jgi:ATP-dependent helicase HrpA